MAGVIVSVEAAVLRGDGRYLMLVRGDGEEIAAGTICFPGGGLDFDVCANVLEDTAIRDPGEVADIVWMTPDEIRSHPDAPAWVVGRVERVENRRQVLGW